MSSDKDPFVFISYRRADSSAASRWLAQTIARTYGSHRVFVDTESIRVGENWPARIDEALASATILIVVIGPSWLKMADEDGRRRIDKKDDWVFQEIKHGLHSRIHIIPLLLSNTNMPQPNALPEGIAKLSLIQGFELRDNRWESDLSLLLNTLDRMGLNRQSNQAIRYPIPRVTLKELTELELKTELEHLTNWRVASSEIPGQVQQIRTELFRSFEFACFDDAIAYMSAAVPKINQIQHHPRWENAWRTVSVWLSTWDIGHKISSLDIQLATYLDQLRSTFPPPKRRRK